MKKRVGSLGGALVAAILLAPSGIASAQVSIGETQVTVAGEEVVSTPTCSNGQIPKLSGGNWVCGTDETSAGGNTGLCTLYSLTGQTPAPSLGCPTQEVRYIFATSAYFEGKLDAIPGYAVISADLWCGGEAADAGLTGSNVYLAWLADSNPASAPASRFTKAAPTTWYTLPSGKIVAIGWDDLTDGRLEWGIGEDAAGNLITTAPTAAWTNVKRDGTQRSSADGHCVDWTDNEFTRVKYKSECTYSGTKANPTQVGFRGSTSITTLTHNWTESGASCCDDDNGGPPPPPPATNYPNRMGRLICVQQ